MIHLYRPSLRLVLLIGTLLCFVVGSWPARAAGETGIPRDGQIVFDVLRNGKPFGTHTLTFTPVRDGGRKKWRVDVAISMAVTAGPITLFGYEHSNQELWAGNSLVSVSASTNDNGKDYSVNARREGKGLRVQSSAKNYTTDTIVPSTSYWNKTFLKSATVLNTQKGTLDSIEVQFLGITPHDVAGTPRPARHYRILTKGDTTVDVWYDKATSQWVGLSFTVRGSRLDYKRRNPI